MGRMSAMDHLLIWVGAVPALLSGVAMLSFGQAAGGLISVLFGVVMLAFATMPAAKK